MGFLIAWERKIRSRSLTVGREAQEWKDRVNKEEREQDILFGWLK